MQSQLVGRAVGLHCEYAARHATHLLQILYSWISVRNVRLYKLRALYARKAFWMPRANRQPRDLVAERLERSSIRFHSADLQFWWSRTRHQKHRTRELDYKHYRILEQSVPKTVFCFRFTLVAFQLRFELRTSHFSCTTLTRLVAATPKYHGTKGRAKSSETGKGMSSSGLRHEDQC